MLVFSRNVEINSHYGYYMLLFGWELFFHVIIAGFFISTCIMILSNVVFEGVSPFVSSNTITIIPELINCQFLILSVFFFIFKELFHNAIAVIFLLTASIGMLNHINSEELLLLLNKSTVLYNRSQYYKQVSAYSMHTISAVKKRKTNRIF